ncbi:MAG: hypothetical protein KGL94_11335, partial [Acidobacteriota bacterium]|nr:hypothetical protein [Acidobacteriota bacterium]
MTLGSFDVVVAVGVWLPLVVTVGTVGVVAPTDDAPSTGVFVCGVEGVVAPVEPTGRGGSEGAGTVLGSGVAGGVDVVAGGVGGATCVVSVAGVWVPVEEVAGGVPLDTSVDGAGVTVVLDVPLDVPVDEVVVEGCVSEVEKKTYVAPPDGGGDEG